MKRVVLASLLVFPVYGICAATAAGGDPRDLTGYYTSPILGPPPMTGSGGTAGTPAQPPRMQPTPEAERAFYPAGVESRFNCIPNTAFGYNPYGEQLISTPNRLTWINQYNHVIRRIDIGLPRPANIVPTYTGYSSGRWEGDTLVVNTTDLKPIEARGLPREARVERIEEHIRRSGDGRGIERRVHYMGRLPDGKPVESSTQVTYVRQDDQKLAEFICEEGVAISATIEAR